MADSICPRGNAALQIFTSSIVAVHRCDDKRYYFINLSRIFPPDLPIPGTTDHAVKFLRPEFVKVYKAPLSSDAFQELQGVIPPGNYLSVKISSNILLDYEMNNMEVTAASQYLLKTVIPNFVKDLDILESLPCDSESLTKEMHQRGINMRYLGSVLFTFVNSLR